MAIPTPVAYWKLDESSGNAVDSVGSATLTNTNATYATGKINNGAVFNGTNAKLVKTAYAVGIGNAYTYAGWFNPDVLNLSNRTLFNIRPASGGNNNIALEGLVDGYIRGIQFNSSGTIIKDYRTTSLPLSVGTFYHIAVTWNGTDFKIYVNGAEPTVTKSVDIAGSLTSTDRGVFVGNEAGTGNYWDGMIDELGLWSSALTSSEVLELYNSGSGKTYPFSNIASQAITATTALTSAVTKGMSKTLSSTTSVTSSVIKSISKIIQATTAITSTLIKQIAKTITSTVSVSGILTATRVFLQSLTSTILITADLSTLQAKVLSSIVSVTSTLTKTLSMTRTLTGTTSVTSTFTKGIAKTIQSSVEVSGTVMRTVMKMLISTVVSTATVCSQRGVVLTVTTAVTSSLLAGRAVIMNATTSITATTGKQVGKLLQVVLNLTAKLIAPFWKTKYPAHGDGTDYEIKY